MRSPVISVLLLLIVESLLLPASCSQPLLIQLVGEEVFAVSNKCSHLNLSMQGKTALLSATISDGCIVCPAHKTAFDMKTGNVVGEWCPSMPNLPIVGKVNNDMKPLPVYTVRIDGDAVAVEV